MTGLAVVIPGPGAVGSAQRHLGPESVAIGSDADQLDLGIMNSFAPGEVADQHLGTVVELESHDVEIAVVVQIKDRGGTAGQTPGHGDDATLARAESVCLVRAGTVEGEPFFSQPAVTARLNAEQEFTVEEAFSLFVEQHGVNGVAEGIPHARGDKNILVTVCIEIA